MKMLLFTDCIFVPSVGWSRGRASGLQKTKWWGAAMVICLERGADLHMAQLMPLPLTASCFSKIQMVLPFWYRLTRVVPRQRAGKWVYVPITFYPVSCLFLAPCLQVVVVH